MTEDNDDYFVRPQDSRRYQKAVGDAIAAYREEHPLVNCWVGAPLYLELYLEGRRRAHVALESAEVTLFDEEGAVVSTFVYLQSESAYELVEQRLGVGRIEEVRDESDVGLGAPDPDLRSSDERDARVFREKHGGSGEALYYVREAVADLVSPLLSSAEKESLALLREAETVLGEEEREAARDLIAGAIALLDKRSIGGGAAWKDCARALAAIERDMSARLQRPLADGAAEGPG
ncbi:hypothetical protein [Sinorhizobium meliloti]|uniref:hypothetical protein n=1 Tax=Rhizobium meliloti TaxID=382 RepID=UPI00237FE3CA|nr:hypothetical protein [Sinorhizobium meliloti]MDE3767569.1 hypothetical protein [Sinorhizobium meliloti]MDE3779801.1 hypothetical protein [Sinorhizobium meliloti]MDE3807426.1 hypothetical protein [Sinorhizobium meliloti]